jgi:hypothetical protein
MEANHAPRCLRNKLGRIMRTMAAAIIAIIYTIAYLAWTLLQDSEFLQA